MAPEDRKSSKARERAAAAYAAEKASVRRRRNLWIGVFVAAVVGAAIATGIAVQSHTNSVNSAPANGPLVFPSGTVAGGLAVPFGANQNAKPTLTIYEDFRCPFCKEAETMFNPIYSADAQAGKIKVQYHIVNLIDQNDGGTGSIQAGSAAGCAQDAGNAKFKAYHDVLFANQPNEANDAFSSNPLLISLAEQVPGLDSPAFESCVDSGRFQPWVKKNFSVLSAAEGGNVSTPDYLIDGTRFQLTTQSAAAQQAAFTAALDKAIASAG